MKKTLKPKRQVSNVNSVDKSHKEQAESTRNLKIKYKLKVK